MNRQAIGQLLVRLMAVIGLILVSGYLLLSSVFVLSNKSWRTTIEALGEPHAILKLQISFVAGLCCLVLAVIVAAWPLLARRRSV